MLVFAKSNSITSHAVSRCNKRLFIEVICNNAATQNFQKFLLQKVRNPHMCLGRFHLHRDGK